VTPTPSRISQAGAPILALLSVAVAVWLTPADVFLVDWSSSGARRVALLPDVGRLVWMAGAALAIAGVLVGGPVIARRARRHAAPLSLLALVAVPYLPWAADRFPLLLAFAGPLRWGVAAAAVAGVLISVGKARSWAVPAPGPAAVFAASFIVYVAAGLPVTRANGPGGDEPHYLMIAQSLLADGDLRIENNHAQGEYRSFFATELRPDYLRRGRDGIIYSIHAPGLPALLLPAYAIAGYAGAVVAVCALAALALVPLFLLARAIAGARSATMAWLATAFTLPLAGHAWTIYPEVPAATVTAWAAWWLWAPGPSRNAAWALRGAALGLLPFFHTKFVALLVPLIVCFIVKLRAQPRAVAALVLPVAVSLAVWICSFWVMYGVASPFIPYGSFEPAKLYWRHVPRGVLGSLFDQEYGLFVHAPVYLMAIPGLWWFARDRTTRWLACALVVTTGIFLAAVMRTYMWWGGTSSPGRFLVPVAVLAAPVLAVAFARTRASWNGVGVAGIAASIGIWTLMALPSLRLMPRNRTGVGAFVSLIEGQAPLTAVLPSFIDVPWWNQLPAVLLMLGSVVAALGAASVLARRSGGLHASYWVGITASVGAVALFAIVGSFIVEPAARTASANRSRIMLMMNYDPPRLSPFDYQERRWIGDEDLWWLGRLVYAADALTPNQPSLLARPVPLPAGRYQAAFWFVNRPPEATVAVSYSGRPPAPLAHQTGDRSNPAIVEFELPVTARGVEFALEPAGLFERLTRVELKPTGIVPRSSRPDAGVPRAMMPIGGRAGAFVCFLDENSYPEPVMSWVRGGRTASMLVVPAGASLIRVKLQAGAARGPVSVMGAGQHTRVVLAAYGSDEVYVPVPSGARFVAIDVTSAGGFRPADVDPESADRRYLGVYVKFELLE
jgi:hypothetical protein